MAQQRRGGRKRRKFYHVVLQVLALKTNVN